ncbi:MFS transporter [Novosphingobium beihaiensis]|uniref:MFS transporter n=1 Tax=Novosphingobium beihaiensis TaxID=2930389 RepID=A0ABT0BLC5_9SPHN|nr:MFS transporter [Novosphingobium beihaiensis]MCJ2185760.1 MFS transporter [Novosphingobium beihaiensis]
MNTLPDTTALSPQAPLSTSAALTVVSLATALVLAVFTIPLTTLGSTSAALGSNAGGLAWILSAMPLGCAIGLLPGGALGDDYGRRRVFNAGLALMALSLAGGMLVTGTAALVLLRVVQGIGGAAVMACGLGLLAKVFPEPAQRTHATAMWATALGAGVAIGPILAAVIDGLAGWRSVYGVEAILAAALAIAGTRFLPESRADQARPLDLSGTLTLGTGMAAVLAGMTEARADWTRPLVFGLAIAGILLLAAFIAIEYRKRQPMLDLALFRRGDFTGAILGAFFSGTGVLAIMSLVPTILHRAYGTSPVVGAFVLLAWSAMTAIAALLAKRLPGWATPPRVIVGGLLACAIGQAATGFTGPDGSYLHFLPGMLLAGIANGLLNAALGQQAIASVPPERAAMGSGANNTARYLGSAAGLTLAALLVAHAGPDNVLDGWNLAVIVSALLSLLGAVCVILAGRSR